MATAARPTEDATDPRWRAEAGGPLLVAARAETVAHPRGAVWPLAATALVVASALAARPALIDGGTGGAITTARLVVTRTYLLGGPLFNLLDLLTLLSVRQHIAIGVTTIATAMLVAAVRTRRAAPRTLTRHAVPYGATVGVALAGVLSLYATGILVPRPMASLSLGDPAELAIDVHSHTDASHDGRAGFGPEENRAWHQAAGFAASYVTDHRSFDAAASGARMNPRASGERTVLLSGIETVYAGAHLNVLGATIADSAIDHGGHLDRVALGTAPREDRGPALSILTIPADLERIPRGARLRGIELSDAAPRGIEAGSSHRARILRLADSLNLALVAGSDNHGWGRTAAAWTVMRIPGWRELSPAALDRAIRTSLDRQRRGATSIVDRAAVRQPRNALELAATAPMALWGMFVTISPIERVMWVAWAWAAWLALKLFADARTRLGTESRAAKRPMLAPIAGQSRRRPALKPARG